MTGRRLWAALFLVGCAACRGGAAGDDGPLLPAVAVDCPALPDGLSAEGFAAWPHPDAGDLVPDLPSLCESPVSPYLLPLLNEAVFWNVTQTEAAGLGVLHRDGRSIGTFTTIRLSPDVSNANAQPYEGSGAARTEVGDVELVWRAANGHVLVEWADERERVAIAAESAELASECVARWLAATGHEEGVTAPDEIPELGDSYPALEAGPPLAGLPEGYEGIEIDAITFQHSDFADSVTMFDADVDALGGAVIVTEERVVGTVIAGKGDPGIGTWPDELVPAWDERAAGFTAGDTSVAVVGYDEAEVERFVERWERELKG